MRITKYLGLISLMLSGTAMSRTLEPCSEPDTARYFDSMEQLNSQDCVNMAECENKGYKLIQYMDFHRLLYICLYSKQLLCPELAPFKYRNEYAVSGKKRVSYCVEECKPSDLIVREYIRGAELICRPATSADGSRSSIYEACLRMAEEFPEIYDLNFNNKSFGSRQICNTEPWRNGVLIQKPDVTQIERRSLLLQVLDEEEKVDPNNIKVNLDSLYSLYTNNKSDSCPWNYVARQVNITATREVLFDDPDYKPPNIKVLDPSYKRRVCIFDPEAATVLREKEEKEEDEVNHDVEDLGLSFMYIFLLILGVVASLEVIIIHRESIKVPEKIYTKTVTQKVYLDPAMYEQTPGGPKAETKKIKTGTDKGEQEVPQHILDDIYMTRTLGGDEWRFYEETPGQYPHDEQGTNGHEPQTPDPMSTLK